MTVKTNQGKRIIAHLLAYGTITAREAMTELGIMRLASRIHDLVKLGVPVKGETVEVVNRFGETVRVKEYSLSGPIPDELSWLVEV